MQKVETKKEIYIVRDEITDMGDIATYDYKQAKAYAKALVKNYRYGVLRTGRVYYKTPAESRSKIETFLANQYLELKSEKIKLSNKDKYSYWGRKAEVEAYPIVKFKPTTK